MVDGIGWKGRKKRIGLSGCVRWENEWSGDGSYVRIGIGYGGMEEEEGIGTVWVLEKGRRKEDRE